MIHLFSVRWKPTLP